MHFCGKDQHWFFSFLNRQYRDTHASNLGGRSHTFQRDAAQLLSAEFTGWLTLSLAGFSAGWVVVEAAGSFQAILAGFAMLLLAGPWRGRSWGWEVTWEPPQMWGCSLWSVWGQLQPERWWGTGCARQGRARERHWAPMRDNWTLGWCFWIVRGSWLFTPRSALGF